MKKEDPWSSFNPISREDETPWKGPIARLVATIICVITGALITGVASVFLYMYIMYKVGYAEDDNVTYAVKIFFFVGLIIGAIVSLVATFIVNRLVSKNNV